MNPEARPCHHDGHETWDIHTDEHLTKPNGDMKLYLKDDLRSEKKSSVHTCNCTGLRCFLLQTFKRPLTSKMRFQLFPNIISVDSCFAY